MILLRCFDYAAWMKVLIYLPFKFFWGMLSADLSWKILEDYDRISINFSFMHSLLQFLTSSIVFFIGLFHISSIAKKINFTHHQPLIFPGNTSAFLCKLKKSNKTQPKGHFPPLHPAFTIFQQKNISKYQKSWPKGSALKENVKIDLYQIFAVFPVKNFQ